MLREPPPMRALPTTRCLQQIVRPDHRDVAMLGSNRLGAAGRSRSGAARFTRTTGRPLCRRIYIAVSVIPMLLIPQAELANSQAPFVDLLNRLLGGNSGRWLALFVVISGLGALNGWTLLVGELTRTMAANGTLPIAFTRCNGRGAPALA